VGRIGGSSAARNTDLPEPYQASRVRFPELKDRLVAASDIPCDSLYAPDDVDADFERDCAARGYLHTITYRSQPWRGPKIVCFQTVEANNERLWQFLDRR
jgi:hypothetical protein